MDTYAVVGNPVAHSRSPEIHEAFAAQTGQQLRYVRLLAPLHDFVGTVERFFLAEGGSGLNVTLPFKEQAFDWVDERDEFAGSAGAVNTIVRLESRFRGCNTDGVGLVRDLEGNVGIRVTGQRILVLGAGGAVRGVLGPLLGRAPGAIVVANRTRIRAEALIDRFEDPRLSAVALDEIEGRFDLVINGTSAGTKGDPIQIHPRVVEGALAYDMAYGAGARAFAEWARSSGARRVVDGLGMLVEQAAESFRLWRGVLPRTEPVLSALRRRS